MSPGSAKSKRNKTEIRAFWLEGCYKIYKYLGRCAINITKMCYLTMVEITMLVTKYNMAV